MHMKCSGTYYAIIVTQMKIYYALTINANALR